MLYTKLSYDHQKVSWYQEKSFLSILSMNTLVFWTVICVTVWCILNKYTPKTIYLLAFFQSYLEWTGVKLNGLWFKINWPGGGPSAGVKEKPVDTEGWTGVSRGLRFRLFFWLPAVPLK